MQALLALRAFVTDQDNFRTLVSVEIADNVWSPISISNHTDANHIAPWDLRTALLASYGKKTRLRILWRLGRWAVMFHSIAPSGDRGHDSTGSCGLPEDFSWAFG
jgi:hypothetical protein